MMNQINRLFAGFLIVFLAGCAALGTAQQGDAVLVAGATGRTGQHVVQQLVAEGYTVRVLVRDAGKARTLFGDTVEVAVGDVTEPATLVQAFDGINRVVSAIGSTAKQGPGSPEFIDYRGNNNLVDAAVNARVEQFVLVSSMGVTHENHPLNKMFNNVLIWKFKNEDYLRNSGLSYTIIRPGGLHDKGAGEQLIVLEQGDIRKVVAIARADVAAVSVAALRYPQARNKTFEVFTVKQPSQQNWPEQFSAIKPDSR